MHSISIFELGVTVKNTKIWSVAQKCFYGGIISPATITHA
jgi:hypothetical protein